MTRSVVYVNLRRFPDHHQITNMFTKNGNSKDRSVGKMKRSKLRTDTQKIQEMRPLKRKLCPTQGIDYR